MVSRWSYIRSIKDAGRAASKRMYCAGVDADPASSISVVQVGAMNDDSKVCEKTREMQLDEMADFHARLSRCESTDIQLSRRITGLEDGARGAYSDDPMKAMTPIIWVMVLLTVAPLVIDLVKQWRLSS